MAILIFLRKFVFLVLKNYNCKNNNNNNNNKIKNYICNTNTPKSKIPVNLTTTALQSKHNNTGEKIVQCVWYKFITEPPHYTTPGGHYLNDFFLTSKTFT